MTKHDKEKASERPLTPGVGAIQCSARNRFPGVVKAVTPGAVNSEVVVTLPSALEVVAIVTNDSVRQLGLKEGWPATVLVKASSVLLAIGNAVVSSARNAFAGTVSAVREGAVNGEVRVALAGGEEVTATITNASIRQLGLEEGISATVLVKASSVLLATD
jgi:molybdate transport system regulatory protein